MFLGINPLSDSTPNALVWSELNWIFFLHRQSVSGMTGSFDWLYILIVLLSVTSVVCLRLCSHSQRWVLLTDGQAETESNLTVPVILLCGRNNLHIGTVDIKSRRHHLISCPYNTLYSFVSYISLYSFILALDISPFYFLLP